MINIMTNRTMILHLYSFFNIENATVLSRSTCTAIRYIFSSVIFTQSDDKVPLDFR